MATSTCSLPKSSRRWATDRKGQFKIAGVTPGIYNIESDGLSDDLMLESSEMDFEISPHGCVETLLVAVHNATISGRVTLPPGFDVEGTTIGAFDPDGREVADADADSDGRYTIAGIASGEYVIGVFAGRFPPTLEKPFRPTYTPAAPDRAHASKVRIATGTHVKDVDIVVNAATPTTTIRVKAKFDDGTPVTEAFFSLTDIGDQFGGEHADGSGSAVLAPAYRAEVSLHRLSTPFFSGAFQTDSHGHADLPAPDDGEIKLSASARSTSAPPNPPSQCMSKETVLTRERGLRWRLSSDASTWHDASEPIVLHLAGPDCIQ